MTSSFLTVQELGCNSDSEYYFGFLCSAKTSPLRKQNIFVKWQLFQLIFDLNLEQHGRVLDAIFWVIIKDFCLFRPIIDKS